MRRKNVSIATILLQTLFCHREQRRKERKRVHYWILFPRKYILGVVGKETENENAREFREELRIKMKNKKSARRT